MFLFRRKSQDKAKDPLVLKPAKAAKTPDINLDHPNPEQAAAPVDPVMPARRRSNKGNKTRLMGFDTSDGHVVGLFDEDKASTETLRMQFPVGMVMVTKGPGFGECFAIKAGMSQIGRGDDQAVCLDFGDMAISRENHAAIVYDAKDHSFLLGHGGKSNIVRLNGKPVVSTSDLKDGDEIEIGETRMRFVAICSDDFSWERAEHEEGGDDDDMEIA